MLGSRGGFWPLDIHAPTPTGAAYDLSQTVGIVRVPGSVSFELVAEVVDALTRGDVGSYPEGAAQACVAVPGGLGATAERA